MSEPTRHRAFKFGMWHQQVNLCQVCANYATGAKNGHSRGSHVLHRFIAHLIRRLIGELIVYQSLRRPSANLAQISYGDSLGWGNESLFKWSWSHDQDGCHAHIW